MPTNEQIFSLYEVLPQDYDDNGVTPIDMDAVAGATAKILTLNFPAAPLYCGFRPTTAFAYDTQTVEGVLALYRYPGGDASAKVLLAEIPLEDAAALHNQYMVKVVNKPPAGTDGGHAKEPVADCVPQDQLAWWIKTQATGGGYLAGAFQPVLFIQRRGESIAKQPAWHDRTPVSTGIASAT